jgi:hypothetical protein
MSASQNLTVVWRDANRPESFDALLTGLAVVRQVLDAENVTFFVEWTDR